MASCSSCWNQSSYTWWMVMNSSSSCAGGCGLQPLGGQQPVELQVAAVGEPGALLTELDLRVLDGVSPPPGDRRVLHLGSVGQIPAPGLGSDMMHRMRFSHDLAYDAAPEAVAAMLADPAFREQVCDGAARAPSRGVGAGRRRRNDGRGRPDPARPGVSRRSRRSSSATRSASCSGRGGATPRSADLDIEIPGKPGTMKGGITLVGDGAAHRPDGRRRHPGQAPARGRPDRGDGRRHLPGRPAGRAAGRRCLAGRPG